MEPVDDRLVGEHTVSAITGIKTRTLRKWRRQGRGPRVKRIEGRLIRYSLQDLHDWMRDQPLLRTTQPNTAANEGGAA